METGKVSSERDAPFSLGFLQRPPTLCTLDTAVFRHGMFSSVCVGHSGFPHLLFLLFRQLCRGSTLFIRPASLLEASCCHSNHHASGIVS